MPHALNSGLPRDYLRPCVLLLLREGDAHGYELLERVDVFGFDRSDPGALYRMLRRLESEGLVSSGWQVSSNGPRKRVYSLTDSGLGELDRRASEPAEGERQIDLFLSRYLSARRLSGASPKRRAIAGRMAAHRAAAEERGPVRPSPLFGRNT
jgi:PadR family transcriptional regulator, regulatory protein PadR